MAPPLWKTARQSPQKLNVALTTQVSNPTNQYTPKRNLCPHENLYTDVRSSTLHSSRKVESPRVSIKK